MKKRDWKKDIATFLIATQVLTSAGVVYAAPSKIHAHKALKKWDYHQTNYDKAGNIRIEPKSVLFDTENEGQEVVDHRIPELHTEDTDYGKNVEITFDASTPEAKQWRDNICKIVKENIYTGNPDSEMPINYKIEDDKIILYSDSRAIDFNDEHKLKIYSTGYKAKNITIHIVKEGIIKIAPEFSPVEGLDLLFILENFNYRVTNPIYEVLLDGEKLEGDCQEYHVVSKIVRLENKALDKITKGKHVITIRAKGYKDFVKGFIVKENDGTYALPKTNHKQELKSVPRILKTSKLSIDAVSGASGSTTGQDAVSGASGSLDQLANIVFDFDLVSNAKILEKLGKETKNSKSVLEVWNSAQKDAAIKDGVNRIVSWSGFTNAVLDAEVKEKHVTFEEYLKDPGAQDYANRPYNVKYVLEDGLYGEVQPFDKSNLASAPAITVGDVKLGRNVKLTFTGKEWSDAIYDVKVGTNILLSDEYQVKDGVIELKSNRFTTGKNKVTIIARGYKNKEINVLVEKSLINLNIDSDTNKTGQDINVLGITEDFVRNIQSVMLNGKMLLNQEAVGAGDWGYKVQRNKIVLNKTLFSDDTKQTLIIEAYGYKEKRLQFKLEKGTIVINPIKDVVPIVKTTQGILGKDVVITWKNDNSKWREAITRVTVGNTMVSGDKYAVDKGQITIDASVFRKGNNEIVIKATKYSDVELTQEMIANVPEITVTKSNTTDGVKLSIPAGQSKWLDSITEIKVNNTKIDTKNYKKEISSIVIDKEIVSVEKEYKIEVLADKYKTAEFNVVVKDMTKPFVGTTKPAITVNVEEKELWDNIEITFKDSQEFRTSIQEVTIDDVKVEEDIMDISKGKIVIEPDAIEELGTYNIKIVAYGYKDIEVKQEIVIEKNIEKPKKILTPPNNLENIKHINKTENLVIQSSDWTNAINKIVVNGKTLTKDTDYYTNTSDADFIIKGSVFNTPGEATVTFSADGYKELKIKFMVKYALEVPAGVRLAGDSKIAIGQDIVIKLPLENINPAYKVEEVCLGEEKLSGESKVSINSVKVYVKGKNFNKPGDYKIILKAVGYKDKVIDITVIGEAIPEKKYDAPVLTADTTDNYLGEDIEITFSNADGWNNNIEEININNKVLSSNDLNKVDKETGKLTFKAALFSTPRTYEIEITANGFKNTTVTQEIKKVVPKITTNLSNETVNSETFKFTAKATDSVSGDIIVPIVTLNSTEVQPKTGTIEYEVTLQEGTNSIAIEVKDKDGLESSASYNVKYEKKEEPKTPDKDKQKPVITLKGEKSITVKKGASYEDEGVTIQDNKDLKAVATYTKDGQQVDKIDTVVAGNYTVHYNVSDEAGNKADEVIRTVIVEEVEKQGKLKDAPIIKKLDKKYAQWGSVDIKIENYDKEWENQITAFIFQGDSYSKNENYKIEKAVFSNNFHLEIDKKLFPHTDVFPKYIKKGTYNMTIKAEGYSDATFSIKLKTN